MAENPQTSEQSQTQPAVKSVGVRLTDGFMMVPRKSYSFRVNFYPAPVGGAPGGSGA